jgi:hypothetical protein
MSPLARRRRIPYRHLTGRPSDHGAALLTHVLRTVHLDSIDKRSGGSVFLGQRHEELTDQLGDDATLAQQVLIEQCVRPAPA